MKWLPVTLELTKCTSALSSHFVNEWKSFQKQINTKISNYSLHYYYYYYF